MYRMAVNKLLFLYLSLTLIHLVSSVKYEPNWESLDSRPLPSWYDEGKLGIFIHWGVFSVPSFVSEWFWEEWRGHNPAVVAFMKKNYRPGFTYADFAPMFTAEFFNPDQWADIFKASGARYVVLTSKHHEGFTNWPSNVSFNWNAMDVGPKRDLVGDLAKSIRKRTDIHFGLYHSLFEWFNPLYERDAHNHHTTHDFVERKTMPELYEIVNTYKPEVIWSDGDWMVNDSYWNATNFLAWLYNESPVKDSVVVNDRWGKNCRCKHGGFINCHDKYNPGKLQKRKWENAMTIQRSSWGYTRNSGLSDYLTIQELITKLAETISCGGNLLMNIGPTHDGRIMPIFEERLRQMGSWMAVNGEAVYSTKPWTYQNDTITPGIWYTSKKDVTGLSVYAFVLKWPEGDTLTLGAPNVTSATVVKMLGYPDPFDYKSVPSGGIAIKFPAIPINKIPSLWAWVFKFQGLKN